MPSVSNLLQEKVAFLPSKTGYLLFDRTDHETPFVSSQLLLELHVELHLDQLSSNDERATVDVPVPEPCDAQHACASSVHDRQHATPERRAGPAISFDDPGQYNSPLRPEQQAAHELQVGSDGFVYQGGRRFSTGTWDESRYVMGADGKMYADRPVRTDGMFPDNHTSFLAGQPAAAAGEVEAHGGVIKSVNNSSGHYAPTVRHTDQMLEELKTRGVDTSRIQNNKTF